MLILTSTVSAEEKPTVIPSSQPHSALPIPVVDTVALRDALRIPLNYPQYRLRFDWAGRYSFLDRSTEAGARITNLISQLRNDPSDAERCDELCVWHQFHDEPETAKVWAARAARFYCDRLEIEPQNSLLLVHYSEATLESGNRASAELQARKAIAVDPDRWQAWFLLARVLLERAVFEPVTESDQSETKSVQASSIAASRIATAFLPGDLQLAKMEPPIRSPIEQASFEAPNLDGLKRTRRYTDEAGYCLSRALEADPKEPAVWLARCIQRQLAEDVRLRIDGKVAKTCDVFSIPGNLADVRAALANRPDDPELIGIATGFEVMAARSQLLEGDDRLGPRQTALVRWQLFYSICKNLEQLEAISAKSDRPTAARAGLMAAYICRKIGQPFRAGLHIRCAMSADPDNHAVWEAYVAELAETGAASEYLAAASKAAARFDTLAFHLRVADALARSNEIPQALRKIQQVRQRFPDYVPALLGEAAMRLKIEGAEALPKAGVLLQIAAAAPHSDTSEAAITDITLLAACAYLIGGNADGTGSRAELGLRLLKDLARREPNHPRVKAALAAVE
jgi:tetratricopeptide (TPR) repeat protein